MSTTEQKAAAALAQINECLYDHGAGKYKGPVSAQQRNQAFDNARSLAVDVRRLSAENEALRAQVEALTRPAVPVAWMVWWGIGEMRPHWPPFKSEQDAKDHASMIKSNTEVRPLFAAAPQPEVTRPAVPEGWKLVPVAPTPEMLAAAAWCKGVGYSQLGAIRKAYRAMLDAAPWPEAPRPALPEGWKLVLPGGRATDPMESARVSDFNAGWNQYRKVATAALEKLAAAPQPSQQEAACWCLTCRPIMTFTDPASVRMALCPTCGNKRCPKATDHRNTCTGSNEPGQLGSAYPATQPTEAVQPDPCPGCIPGGFCKKPTCGRLLAVQKGGE